MPKLLLVFVSALSTGVVLPLPEEAVLIGTSLAAEGEHPVLVGLVAFLGLYLRDTTLFVVGRVAGTAVFGWGPVRRLVGDAPLASLQERAEANAVTAVVAARMAFGVRAAAQVTLGAVGVPARTHLLVNGAVLALWVPLLVGIGVFFHEPATAALGWASENRSLLIAFACIVAFAWFTRREIPEG
jgi:membrane protein DedA with SNARE-associated domain